MRRITLLILLVLLAKQSLAQKGFPTQFQATLNISGWFSWPILTNGPQQLLYDYVNLRARFDVPGWRTKQNETYLVKFKPEGAEPGSPASQGYTMFNFNPDYPEKTKNDCWYRTDPMNDIGPFPQSWFYDSAEGSVVKPWLPLPSDLIKKGEEWVPEAQKYAMRYDSPEICDLKRSSMGKVPCLSYFEADDKPVQTIEARAARGAYDADDYKITTYLSFTFGIPSKAEHLFDLPHQWPTFCGNANSGFTVEPMRGYVVTPQGQDRFTLKLQTPPIHSLGDQVKVEFKVQPSRYFNGTRCAQFNTIIFDREHWQEPKQVDMSFGDYGCCSYAITAVGGGYEWQYTVSTFAVYACDGQAGYGCNGKSPCGE